MENNTVELLASLLDCAWLAAEVGVCHKTVLHILHDILGYHKLAARLIPYGEQHSWTPCFPVGLRVVSSRIWSMSQNCAPHSARHFGLPQTCSASDTIWRTTQLNSLLPCWTARGLAAEVGVCHKTVLHILHDILGYRKLAARWIPREISEVQQWHRYAVAQVLLDRYLSEDDDFLVRIVVTTKPWLVHTSQTWNANQVNGNIPDLLVQWKCALHNVKVKVMFIVAYDIDGAMLHHAVHPRQAVNASYYCTFLHHLLRPALRRKRRHLVV